MDVCTQSHIRRFQSRHSKSHIPLPHPSHGRIATLSPGPWTTTVWFMETHLFWAVLKIGYHGPPFIVDGRPIFSNLAVLVDAWLSQSTYPTITTFSTPSHNVRHRISKIKANNVPRILYMQLRKINQNVVGRTFKCMPTCMSSYPHHPCGPQSYHICASVQRLCERPIDCSERTWRQSLLLRLFSSSPPNLYIHTPIQTHSHRPHPDSPCDCGIRARFMRTPEHSDI